MAVTIVSRQCGTVPAMVTKQINRPKVPAARKAASKVVSVTRRPFYLKEWRKFMGIGVMELAIALKIERQSYHRLEKNWWTINTGEQDILARVIGIKPSQFWFPPPTKGKGEPETVDDLMEDIPEEMRPAAFLALKGMGRR